MTGRELLLGSSFQFGTGGEDGGPSWTVLFRTQYDDGFARLI